MAMYLVISDGTTTVTIADGSGGATNYILERGTWSPQIAGLRRSQLAGRGPYEEVVEEMRLHITGSTVAAALANLGALVGLLEQAERWHKGESVGAVLLKYSPDGATTSSSGTPLQAAILGRAPGDSTSVTLPVNFDDAGGSGWVVDVTIRFWRRGLWLFSTTAAASSATANRSTATIALGSATTAKSPFDISLTNVLVGNDATPYDKWPIYFVLSDASTNLIYNEQSGGFPSGDPAFIYTDESAKFAPNTKTIRYTPTDTTQKAVVPLFPSFTIAAGEYAVFVLARNNSATTSFTVTFGFVSNASVAGERSIASVTKTIPPYSGAASPRWWALGYLAIAGTFETYLYAQASAAAGTLDIDSVYLVKLNSNTSIIELHRSNSMTSPNKFTTAITARLLTYPTPIAAIATEPTTFTTDIIFSSGAANIYAALLGSGGVSTPDRWRHEESAAVLSNTWTLTRYNGYLTPV